MPAPTSRSKTCSGRASDQRAPAMALSPTIGRLCHSARQFGREKQAVTYRCLCDAHRRTLKSDTEKSWNTAGACLRSGACRRVSDFERGLFDAGVIGDLVSRRHPPSFVCFHIIFLVGHGKIRRGRVFTRYDTIGFVPSGLETSGPGDGQRQPREHAGAGSCRWAASATGAARVTWITNLLFLSGLPGNSARPAWSSISIGSSGTLLGYKPPVRPPGLPIVRTLKPTSAPSSPACSGRQARPALPVKSSVRPRSWPRRDLRTS